MNSRIKIIWLIIVVNVTMLTACQQKEEIPYLFIENNSLNDHNQKSIFRISADGSHIEHMYDFEERTLYWFSPDFNYVAFTDNIPNSEGSEPVLTLVDVRTNQVVVQIPDITPYFRQNSAVWDPTGSKLLFDRTISDRGSTDWWIYDVTNNSQEILTTNTSIKLFPAWSVDGQYVAFISTPCPDYRDNCNRIGDVWDISVVNIDTNIIRNVTNFADNSISLARGTGDELFCNLKWSNDNRFIAFKNQCIPGGPIYEKHRIFIVDTTDMVVKEALKFEQPYSYGYSYEWLETNDLLIGYSQVNTFNFQTFLKGGVLSFDPLQTLDTRSAELLGFRGSEISWSPDGSTFIVFTQEPIFETPQSGQLSGSGATLLGTFLDGFLTIYPESKELPHGLCQGNTAHWSDDGQFITFSSIGEQHICNQDVIDSNVFVYSIEDKQLNNLTQTLEGVSRPIGWLPEFHSN